MTTDFQPTDTANLLYCAITDRYAVTDSDGNIVAVGYKDECIASL